MLSPNLVYEEIDVSCSKPNSDHLATYMKTCPKGFTLPKNVLNVFNSSEELKLRVYQTLREGYYPIVLGGDHSQAIGSISGMKKAFPKTKVLWIDAHINANTPDTSPSGNAHGMPVSYLTGQNADFKHWNCMKLDKDLLYFGIRSYEPEEKALIDKFKVPYFESADCKAEDIDKIEEKVLKYFKHIPNDTTYWFSFDIDGVCANDFKSTGTDEGNGINLLFIYTLFERFLPRTVGMDFTEVNFTLTKGTD